MDGGHREGIRPCTRGACCVSGCLPGLRWGSTRCQPQRGFPVSELWLSRQKEDTMSDESKQIHVRIVMVERELELLRELRVAVDLADTTRDQLVRLRAWVETSSIDMVDVQDKRGRYIEVTEVIHQLKGLADGI